MLKMNKAEGVEWGWRGVEGETGGGDEEETNEQPNELSTKFLSPFMIS